MVQREKINNAGISDAEMNQTKMSDNGNEQIQDADIIKLSHELTYRRFLLSDGKIRSFFQKLTIPEYLALHIINDSEMEEDSGKTYLTGIAEKMQRTVRQTSHMVKALQERGMIAWSHDGDGSAGTYVSITQEGRKMLAEEEDVLKEFYGSVFAKFGKDSLMELLQLMKQLESIMSAEFKAMEGNEV